MCSCWCSSSKSNLMWRFHFIALVLRSSSVIPSSRKTLEKKISLWLHYFVASQVEKEATFFKHLSFRVNDNLGKLICQRDSSIFQGCSTLRYWVVRFRSSFCNGTRSWLRDCSCARIIRSRSNLREFSTLLKSNFADTSPTVLSPLVQIDVNSSVFESFASGCHQGALPPYFVGNLKFGQSWILRDATADCFKSST